jgi:hypothetical protein
MGELLLFLCGVNGVRWSDLHGTEQLVPESSTFEVDTAVEKWKRYKSLSVHQISALSIQAGGRTLHSEIHKLMNSAWNKEELLQLWKESVIVGTYL